MFHTRALVSPSLSPSSLFMLIDCPNSVVRSFLSLWRAHILWLAAEMRRQKSQRMTILRKKTDRPDNRGATYPRHSAVRKLPGTQRGGGWCFCLRQGWAGSPTDKLPSPWMGTRGHSDQKEGLWGLKKGNCNCPLAGQSNSYPTRRFNSLWWVLHPHGCHG